MLRSGLILHFTIIVAMATGMLKPSKHVPTSLNDPQMLITTSCKTHRTNLAIKICCVLVQVIMEILEMLPPSDCQVFIKCVTLGPAGSQRQLGLPVILQACCCASGFPGLCYEQYCLNRWHGGNEDARVSRSLADSQQETGLSPSVPRQ